MSVTQRPIRGALRRTVTRLFSRLPQPTGPTSTPARARRRRIVLPSLLSVTLAQVLLLLEQPGWALVLLRRAGGSSSRRSVLIGKCLLQIGASHETTVMQYLGVSRTVVGDPAGALASFEAALRLDPDSEAAHDGGITALISLGRFDDAEELARTAGSRHLYLTALVHESRLRSQSTLDQQSARAIVSLLEDHVRAAPADTVAQNRLANLHIATGEFAEAQRAATAVGSSDAKLLSEWAGLTRRGEYLDAHRKKLAFARAVSAVPPSRSAKIGDYVRFAQSMNYCSGALEAAEAIAARLPFAASTSEREIVAKVRADLDLLCGDPRQLREFRRRRPTPSRLAEDAFRSLVTDRHVLVIGPAPCSAPPQAQIDAADVVVTTTSAHVALTPGQPQITYVTDEAALLLSSDDLVRLEQDRHRLLVVRPSVLKRSLAKNWQHGTRVRTMQFEDSTPLLGTHFGVQRILYDLIASDADSIAITGMDFFLGAQAYKPGYQLHGQPADHRLPLMNFSHDYAYGFRFVKTLCASGLVTADDEIGAILTMSVPAYLELLGQRHPDTPPGLAP